MKQRDKSALIFYTMITLDKECLTRLATYPSIIRTSGETIWMPDVVNISQNIHQSDTGQYPVNLRAEALYGAGVRESSMDPKRVTRIIEDRKKYMNMLNLITSACMYVPGDLPDVAIAALFPEDIREQLMSNIVSSMPSIFPTFTNYREVNCNGVGERKEFLHLTQSKAWQRILNDFVIHTLMG